MENNKLNVIIDTNVIISSLITTNELSPTSQVMELFYDGKINVFYSNEIMKEYIEVLNRDKFKFNKEDIQFVINFFKEFAINIEVAHKNVILQDMKDLAFYEIVIDKKVKNGKLITGNKKHFPIEPFIMTPAEFMNKYYWNCEMGVLCYGRY